MLLDCGPWSIPSTHRGSRHLTQKSDTDLGLHATSTTSSSLNPSTTWITIHKHASIDVKCQGFRLIWPLTIVTSLVPVQSKLRTAQTTMLLWSERFRQQTCTTLEGEPSTCGSNFAPVHKRGIEGFVCELNYISSWRLDWDMAWRESGVCLLPAQQAMETTQLQRAKHMWISSGGVWCNIWQSHSKSHDLTGHNSDWNNDVV